MPFYGQGMNASFEDVVVLDSCLDQNLDSWMAVFQAYEKARKHNTDSIADLAVDNFHEMKDHVSNPIFKEKRKIEMDLEKTFPTQYSSKYSLVTFNENIGYNEAMNRGRAQDKALLSLIEDKTINTNSEMSEQELKIVLDKVLQETNEILQKH